MTFPRIGPAWHAAPGPALARCAVAFRALQRRPQRCYGAASLGHGTPGNRNQVLNDMEVSTMTRPYVMVALACAMLAGPMAANAAPGSTADSPKAAKVQRVDRTSALGQLKGAEPLITNAATRPAKGK